MNHRIQVGKILEVFFTLKDTETFEQGLQKYKLSYNSGTGQLHGIALVTDIDLEGHF